MATFQPPPTWAEPVLVDERTGKSKFSPVWLKWFLDIVGVINESGGGGGIITHNDTDGLQGGTANQFYHLTAAQHAVTLLLVAASGELLALASTGTLDLLVMTGPVKEAQGAAVTAANNLSLGSDGNYFQIAGATQINLLDSSNWQGGARVTFKFNSTPTVKHNQAVSGNFKPILLFGGLDFLATANDTLSLRYDSTDSLWYEESRTVI